MYVEFPDVQDVRKGLVGVGPTKTTGGDTFVKECDLMLIRKRIHKKGNETQIVDRVTYRYFQGTYLPI